MPEEKFTRCPECRTVFRVTAEQLALRDGQVRCGHCRATFDGVEELVALAPPQSGGDDDGAVDELAQGPPTTTLRAADALEAPWPAVMAETDARPAAPAAPAVSAAPARGDAAEERAPGGKTGPRVLVRTL